MKYTFRPEIMSFGIVRALHSDMLIFRNIKSRAVVMFAGDQWWMLLILCLEFCTTHFYPSVVNFHNEVFCFSAVVEHGYLTCELEEMMGNRGGLL